MGHSITIHCLGYGTDWKSEDGKISRRIYYAMNLLEVKQEKIKAMKQGDQIKYWEAQTKTGMKILGIPNDEYQINALFVKDIKTITCPRCTGNGCHICNWSGVTTKRHLRRYQDWQLQPQI